MSEKLLPIVPGCKAIFIGPAVLYHELLFKEVSVICKSSDECGAWLVDSALVRKLIAQKHHSSLEIMEHKLMRIDGGEFSHEKDSHELGIKA